MTSEDEFLRGEYTALTEYYGKVVTFRFTTAAFFIAAVALVLSVEKPQPQHNVLLFAISLGIWIVELRNRSIYDNLLDRACQIEMAWARPGEGKLPLFMHMAPNRAAERVPIPEDLRRPDQTRILVFPRFRTRHVSHTVGLDILYLSVMAYAVWELRPEFARFMGDRTMDLVSALFAFGVVLVGYRAIRAAPTAPAKWSYFLAIFGSILILGAAALVFRGLCKAA